MSMHVGKERVAWVVSDGKVGHHHQGLGVLASLTQIYPMREYWVNLRLRFKWLRPLLAFILNMKQGVLPLRWFGFFYTGDLPAELPDYVIGAGGDVVMATAWLATMHQAKSIYSGEPKRLRLNLLNVVVMTSSQAVDYKDASNVIALDVKPSPYERLHVRSDLPHTQDSDVRWGICIGGNAKADAHFSVSDWTMLANEMNTVGVQHGVKWLITTSRRTGAEAELILSRLLNAAHVLDVYWWSSADSNRDDVMADILHRADVVVVTADSESMIQEALAARKPVIVVKPAVYNVHQRFWGMLQLHMQKGHCVVIDIRELAEYFDAAKAIAPIDYSPVDVLRQKLIEQPDLHVFVS